MFGVSSAIGIYFGCFGRQQQTTSNYLLGRRRMKILPVSMSLVANSISGISLLGIPAEIYMYGTQYSIMMPSFIFVGFIQNYVYLPVFYKLQLTNAFEYLEIRFDKKTKTLASILYIVTNLLYLPVVIYAPALAFNQVTGYDFHIIAPMMSIICIFYTSIGGFKAVVWADTFQLSATLCTLGYVLIMGTISVGGVRTIWEKSKLGNRLEFFNMNPDPTVRSTFWSIGLGNIFGWTAYLGGDPSTVQRFMAVPTFKDAQRCLLILLILIIVTKVIGCFSGLIIYAKYYECDPLSAGYITKADQILPFYVMEVAAAIPGLSGLFVAGLFSTALSTLSTYLNTLSGILYSDFIAPVAGNTSERTASTIMKIMAVLVGLVSVGLIFVVEKLGSVLEVMLTFRGIAVGPILGLFTMGMLFPFANRKGALVGGAGSFLLMCLIVIKNQIHIWNGTIRYTPKSLHTYGCNVTTAISSILLNETYTSTTEPSYECPSEEPFWLYRISFHYYALIGTFATLFIGLAVSWATNDNDSSVNPDLLSPCIHRFLAKSAAVVHYEAVEKGLHICDRHKNASKFMEPVASDNLVN